MEAHEILEETVFYPEIDKLPIAGELVDLAFDDHAEFDAVLQEIAELPVDKPEWLESSSSLRIWCADTVNEENRLFPIARRELEDCRAEELGRQIEEIKGKESAPDEFVGSRQQTLHLNEYPLQN